MQSPKESTPIKKEFKKTVQDDAYAQRYMIEFKNKIEVIYIFYLIQIDLFIKIKMKEASFFFKKLLFFYFYKKFSNKIHKKKKIFFLIKIYK